MKFIIIIASLFFFACSDTSNPVKQQTSSELATTFDSTFKTDSSNSIEDVVVYILSTDYETGMLSYIETTQSSWQFNELNFRLSGDPEIALFGDLVYIFNRSWGENASILKIDPVAETILADESLEITNPHSISFLNNSKAFITNYDAGNVIVYNPTSMEVLSEIVLPTKTDSTNPAPSGSFIVDEKLYVALGHMESDGFGLTPAYNGEIVVICTKEYDVLETIELPFQNPVSNIIHCSNNNALFISCVGNYFRDDDGGLVKIDIDNNSAEIFAAADILGSDPGDVIEIHNGELYFIQGSWGSYRVSKVEIASPGEVQHIGDTQTTSSVSAFSIANNQAIIAYSAYDFDNSVFYDPQIKIFSIDNNELIETFEVEMPVYKIAK